MLENELIVKFAGYIKSLTDLNHSVDLLILKIINKDKYEKS